MEERVPDDKLESLMAELRAIEFWDRMPESAVLIKKIERTGAFEARRIRRLEIIDEINVLLNKTGRDSAAQMPDSMPQSA
jgi:hypothetical protein